MIRKAQPADYEKLTRLWLESSLLAHAFIDAAYWEKMQSTVRDYYLPNTETYVFEDRQRIKGFISLCENNYIGALFIAPQHQNQRIGTKLLEYSRRKRPNLSLRVFVKNGKALRFYQKSGFKIISEQTDVSTGEIELVMSWGMGCKSGFFKRRQGDS